MGVIYNFKIIMFKRPKTGSGIRCYAYRLLIYQTLIHK